MKVLAAITSPAQDDVIERILRSRGEWDPPWKRQRPACRPPARASPALERCEPNETGPELDDYAVDPPWVDDL